MKTNVWKYNKYVFERWNNYVKDKLGNASRLLQRQKMGRLGEFKSFMIHINMRYCELIVLEVTTAVDLDTKMHIKFCWS